MSKVPEITDEEFNHAVASAVEAQKEWGHTPASVRQRFLFKYQELVRQSQQQLAESITWEHGKTVEDAKGDVFRGYEVIEQSCNAVSAMMGETSRDVAKGIDTYSYKEPLGVVAGIAPFNFPAMIPLWVK